MIKIEQELQIDHIFSYLKKNENDKQEFDRYSRSIAKKVKTDLDDSLYSIFNYMLIKHFNKNDTYLNSLISEMNKDITFDNKKYNLFLVPLFGYSKNNTKTIKFSKKLFSIFEDTIVLDQFFYTENKELSDFLNCESLLKNKTNNQLDLNIDFNNTFSGFVMVLSNAKDFSFQGHYLDKENLYLSIGEPIKYSLSSIQDSYNSFFVREKLIYGFKSITRDMKEDDLVIEIEILESFNDIDILFFNSNVSNKNPTNIISINCLNYEDLIFHIDVIDEILKEKGISYKITQ